MCVRNLKIAKVLVVDDQDDVRELIHRMLENRGYSVVTAASGELALDEIIRAIKASDPYDVVILDYAMCGMDGLTCALKIREEEAKAPEDLCAHVKIGFVTAHPDLYLSPTILRDLDAKQADKLDVVEKLNTLESWLATDRCPTPCA